MLTYVVTDMLLQTCFDQHVVTKMLIATCLQKHLISRFK